MEQIFGIEEKDALGTSFLRYSHSWWRPATTSIFWKRCAERASRSRIALSALLATEQEGFYDAHYSPLFNVRGKVSGGIAFVRDTTERRRAELGSAPRRSATASCSKMRTTSSTPMTSRGNITSLNKAAERITGYARAEALQMKAEPIGGAPSTSRSPAR